MSVQIIKWIILLFVTGNCLSETCKANDAPKVCLPVQSNITIINQADNMLDSLVSFLHFNAGDLTEETTHKTLDKKVFIRLFIQSRHNKIQSPAEDPFNKFPGKQFSPGRITPTTTSIRYKKLLFKSPIRSNKEVSSGNGRR